MEADMNELEHLPEDCFAFIKRYVPKAQPVPAAIEELVDTMVFILYSYYDVDIQTKEKE